ncbi:MAG: TolC family protein [Sulfurovum sp.]
MHIFILVIFMIISLDASSIDTLVLKAIRKHNSLDAIKYRLSAMSEKIELSGKWDNPTLSLSISDIDLDRPFDRGIEKMQYQSIGFKQKVPWFGKLEARENLTIAQKTLLWNSYSEAKVELALQVHLVSYTIIATKKQRIILKRYKELLQKTVSLYSAYISIDKDSHNNSMRASLMESRIEIRLQRYTAVLKANKERLNYLVNSKSKVYDKFRIKRPKSLYHYVSRLHNNPTYKKIKSQSNIASANKRVEDLGIYPDPYLSVGYYNRENFNDYLSVGVGISLPIYGKEKLKSQIAQKALLASKSDLLDYKHKLKMNISIEYAKLKEGYKIYKILTYNSLPKLKHIFELSQSSIQNGGDMVSYINLLTQKAQLEEDIISIKLQYLLNKSRLNALIGEI